MTAKDMQYDVRVKLNKLDSQKYRELRPQEVDWKLNEAQLILINQYYERMNFDKIKELIIIEEKLIQSSPSVENIYKYNLPKDFLYYISGHVMIAKNNCYEVITTSSEELSYLEKKRITVRADLIPMSHIDIHVDSYLDSSSFEWRQVNFNFSGGKTPNDKGNMLLYTDGNFVIVQPHITYIRFPYRIVSLDSYKLPNGETVTYQDCELHESLHNELVDLAVFIASTDLQMRDIQLKREKINLN